MKNIKKRILCTIVAFAMVFSIVPFSSIPAKAADKYSSNLTLTVNIAAEVQVKDITFSGYDTEKLTYKGCTLLDESGMMLSDTTELVEGNKYILTAAFYCSTQFESDASYANVYKGKCTINNVIVGDTSASLGSIINDATHMANNTSGTGTYYLSLTVTLTAGQHDHPYDTAWTTDADYHWHKATCEHTNLISGKGQHTYGDWALETEATCDQEGLKYRTCSVCGYKQTASIPKVSGTSIDLTANNLHPEKQYKDVGTLTGLDSSMTLVGYKIYSSAAMTAEMDADAYFEENTNYTIQVIIENDTGFDTDAYVSGCSSLCKLNGVGATIAGFGHNYDESTFSLSSNSGSAEVKKYMRLIFTIPAGHIYNSDYVSDGNATTEADGTKTRTCTVCGYKDTVTDEGSKLHSHTYGEWTSNNDATTTSDGTKSRTCSVCGYVDTETDAGTMLHSHTFADAWTSDATNHWHEATCDDTDEVSDKAAHTYGEWVSDNNATTEADGTKHRICTVCGYKQTATDTGSMLGSTPEEGEVNILTDKQTGNYADGKLTSTVSELESSVITDLDRVYLKAGQDVNYWLDVDNYYDSVALDEVASISNNMPNKYRLGSYMDVNLYKQVEGASAKKVTEITGGNVKIQFTVPTELQKSGRSYKIIRLHNGTATVINPNVENNTVSFATSQFSLYALVYSDSDTSSQGTTSSSYTTNGTSNANALESTTVTTTDGSSSPQTGDTSNIYIWFAVMLASFAGIASVIIYRRRREY